MSLRISLTDGAIPTAYPGQPCDPFKTEFDTISLISENHVQRWLLGKCCRSGGYFLI